MSLQVLLFCKDPPGTGKTQVIAELCARLCKEGKSVLVTALTNRALIEVATKSALQELLSNGKILKSNLTIDEQHEVPHLVAAKQIMPIKGSVVMGTYYITSAFAANLAGENAFAVVIMDEASQALTPMFAASHKIGLTNLWVGDSAQLGPVVALNGNCIISNGFDFLIDGLCTMVHKRQLPVYQLTKTYRLTQRNADYTGFFYNKSLISAKDNQSIGFKSLEKLIHSGGGPTLLLTDMDVADATPQFAMDLATYLVFTILEVKPTTEIAVLSCFRKSARALQKAVAVRLGIGNKVLIDTIARVQGLTTDVTIFFIPNTSLIRSLEPRLFNVATSRAKSHTIIIADKNICEFPHMNHNVRSFMEKLKAESCLYIPAKANDSKSLTNNNSTLLLS